MRRFSSQVDERRDVLAPDIWYWDGSQWVLRDFIREQFFYVLARMFEWCGGWYGLVRRVAVVGSITTLQYHEFSDVDFNVEVDKEAFKERLLALGYTVGDLDLYGFMMNRLVWWLEGVPVEGTFRNFSIHVYWYPYILASDNIYVLDLGGRGFDRWVKGMNLVERCFVPGVVFADIKLGVEVLRRILVGLVNMGDDVRVRAYLKALEWFFKEWRSHRFGTVKRGIGDFRVYDFSEDWDLGNLIIKYLGEFAKPYKLLVSKDLKGA